MSNSTTIHGRLVRDPELKTGASGSEYCTFCIASDHYNGKENVTDFFNCIAGGPKGVAISKFFSKGKEIVAYGSFESNRKEKDGGNVTYWTVRVSNFDFCGSGKQGQTDAPVIDEESGLQQINTEEVPF